MARIKLDELKKKSDAIVKAHGSWVGHDDTKLHEFSPKEGLNPIKGSKGHTAGLVGSI